MTEQDCIEKVEHLMDALKEETIRESRRLYHSGGVDTQAFGEDYLLPKILITATLPNLIRGRTRPITTKAKKAIANLEHF